MVFKVSASRFLLHWDNLETEMHLLVLWVMSFFTFGWSYPFAPNEIEPGPDFSVFNLSLPLTAYVECNQAGRWSRKNLWTQRCVRAVQELPSDHRHGRFHGQSPMDEFHLPKTTSNEECKVTVDLLGGRHEAEGSWTGVRGAAIELALSCTLKGDLRLTRGGTTRTGQNNAITIRMVGTKWTGVSELEDYEFNSTSAMTENQYQTQNLSNSTS